MGPGTLPHQSGRSRCPPTRAAHPSPQHWAQRRGLSWTLCQQSLQTRWTPLGNAPGRSREGRGGANTGTPVGGAAAVTWAPTPRDPPGGTRARHPTELHRKEAGQGRSSTGSCPHTCPADTLTSQHSCHFSGHRLVWAGLAGMCRGSGQSWPSPRLRTLRGGDPASYSP